MNNKGKHPSFMGNDGTRIIFFAQSVRFGLLLRHIAKKITSISSRASITSIASISSGASDTSFFLMTALFSGGGSLWVEPIEPWCRSGLLSSGRWGCWGSLGGCDRRSTIGDRHRRGHRRSGGFGRPAAAIGRPRQMPDGGIRGC